MVFDDDQKKEKEKKPSICKEIKNKTNYLNRAYF